MNYLKALCMDGAWTISRILNSEIKLNSLGGILTSANKLLEDTEATYALLSQKNMRLFKDEIKRIRSIYESDRKRFYELENSVISKKISSQQIDKELRNQLLK